MSGNHIIAGDLVKPSTSNRKRPPGSPTQLHDPESREKRVRRLSRGHAYSQLALDGNVRAHLGDHHETVYVSGDYYGSTAPKPENIEERNRALLEWLQFPRQDARREQIQPAHQDTFEWIYDEDLDQHDSASNFAEWLRSENGLYWIYGKAGSGKSTLMKMLSSDPRTRELLEIWAGTEPLIMSSFYFWNPGTDMQRSILGLLRSLLCDVLQKCPRLCEIAFPRWHPKFSALDPTLEEVTGAFSRAMNAVDVKVCLLLDGLDEYEGSDIDKAELAKLVTKIVASPHVKAIVSSRPLRIFETGFRGWASLAIHDLTTYDIRSVIAAALESNEHIVSLRELEEEAIDEFIDDMTSRSAGVFLWAAWAVRIVLDGCCHEDRMEELKTRLEQLPRELEQLFRAMLNRVPLGYRKEGSRYLSTALLKKTPLSLTNIDASAMALAAEVETVSLDFWKEQLPFDYIEPKESRFWARLHTATQGLLVGNSSRYDKFYNRRWEVEFMHRSVSDFLRNEGSQLWTKDYATLHDDGFDPVKALMLAFAMRLRLEANPRNHDHWVLMSDFFDVVRMAENSSGSAQTAIVDKLYQYLASHRLWHEERDREFLSCTLRSACELYFEEKQRNQDMPVLQRYRACFPDVIFAHGPGPFRAPEDYERPHTVKLLMHHFIDAEVKYPISIDLLRSFEGALRIDGHEQYQFFPWEMAIMMVYRDFEYDRREEEPFDLRWCLDGLEVLNVVLDATTHLTGSSTLADHIARTMNLQGHDLTVKGLLRWTLDLKCLYCWHATQSDEELENLDGEYEQRIGCAVANAATLSACTCEESTELRSKILELLKKLEERETLPPEPAPVPEPNEMIP